MSSSRISRREFLGRVLSLGSDAGACGVLPVRRVPATDCRGAAARLPGAGADPGPLAADEPLLEEIEQANFLFFWEQANPQTGLVRDRFNTRAADNGVVGSIAATGFGLTAICIGQKRGYVSLAEAQGRALTTLRFIWRKLPIHRGFFFHWANVETGERIWDSEVSSVDTAILLCGVLTCREHFRHPEIRRLANHILKPRRLELALRRYFAAAARLDPGRRISALSLGLLQRTDDDVPARHGIGGPSFARRDLEGVEANAPSNMMAYDTSVHLRLCSFTSTPKHGLIFAASAINTPITFRIRSSPPMSIVASAWNWQSSFPTTAMILWGITASDSQNGYVIWGGPPAMGPIDGTVVPSAAAGSLPFLPEATMRVLKTIRTRYGSAWSRYGFRERLQPAEELV